MQLLFNGQMVDAPLRLPSATVRKALRAIDRLNADEVAAIKAPHKDFVEPYNKCIEQKQILQCRNFINIVKAIDPSGTTPKVIAETIALLFKGMPLDVITRAEDATYEIDMELAAKEWTSEELKLKEQLDAEIEDANDRLLYRKIRAVIATFKIEDGSFRQAIESTTITDSNKVDVNFPDVSTEFWQSQSIVDGDDGNGWPSVVNKFPS